MKYVIVLFTSLLVIGHTTLAGQGVAPTGMVVNAITKEPVSGAVVSFRSSRGGTASAQTDQSGLFEFSPQSVDGVLTVAASGFVPWSLGWSPSSSRRLVIRVFRGTALSGRITGPHGAVKGADVSVLSEEHAAALVSTKTDGDGRYAFRDMPPGRAIVLVKTSELSPIVLSRTLSAVGNENVADMSLQPEGIVRGRVTDSQSAAVAGATIQVLYPRGVEHGAILGSLIRGQRTTNAEGEYEIRGLVPNVPLTVQALSGGRASERVSIVAGPADAVTLHDLRIP